MKKLVIRSIFVCACVLFAAVAVGAQSRPSDRNASKRSDPSAGAVAAKVPIVIVGSAAKLTWATTKFTAKHVAKPVAKTLFLSATPAITKFALKNTAKHLVPLAVKLSVL